MKTKKYTYVGGDGITREATLCEAKTVNTKANGPQVWIRCAYCGAVHETTRETFKHGKKLICSCGVWIDANRFAIKKQDTKAKAS